MAQEALLYKPLKERAVQCILCAHRCYLKPGESGKCRVRFNSDGILMTAAYGNPIAQHVDPIEKKPLYHFYPGSYAYSIAIAGCNFTCQWCQNWDISQSPGLTTEEKNHKISPAEIIKRVKAQRCNIIAYTYTEPTIFFEYTYDISKLAKTCGIKNVYVTNGYMTKEMLEMYNPWLDAANIDIKAFSESTYQKFTGAHLKPVLETCKTMKELGIWIEITTLVIPTINDDLKENQDLAAYIHDELGKDTPWHISRYFPNFNFQSIPATPISTLKQIEAIGKEAGLRYVYVGNVSQESITRCPKCSEILIRRWGTQVVMNKINKDSTCPKCGQSIAGLGMSGSD